MYAQISRKHYKVVILPLRDLSSFLSVVPDTVSLSSLLLPGKKKSFDPFDHSQ